MHVKCMHTDVMKKKKKLCEVKISREVKESRKYPQPKKKESLFCLFICHGFDFHCDEFVIRTKA